MAIYPNGKGRYSRLRPALLGIRARHPTRRKPRGYVAGRDRSRRLLAAGHAERHAAARAAEAEYRGGPKSRGTSVLKTRGQCPWAESGPDRVVEICLRSRAGDIRRACVCRAVWMGPPGPEHVRAIH